MRSSATVVRAVHRPSSVALRSCRRHAAAAVGVSDGQRASAPPGGQRLRQHMRVGDPRRSPFADRRSRCRESRSAGCSVGELARTPTATHARVWRRRSASSSPASSASAAASSAQRPAPQRSRALDASCRARASAAHSAKILPGFMMFFGSSARLTLPHHRHRAGAGLVDQEAHLVQADAVLAGAGAFQRAARAAPCCSLRRSAGVALAAASFGSTR